MNVIEVNVTGMVCEGCANAIKHVLEQLQGVYSIEIDYASGKTVIQHCNADPASIEVAIEGAGFGVDR